MTKHKATLQVLLCAFALVGVARGQGWLSERTGNSVYFPWERQLPSVREIGSLHAKGNEVFWGIIHPVTPFTSTGQDPVSCVVPLDLPGDICPSAIPGRYVASGAASATGNGVLAHVLLAGDSSGPRAIALIDSVDLGSGLDPTTVQWNAADQLLYIADYRTRSIFAAPWDGVGALPGGNSFSQILASQGALDLSTAELELLPTGGLRIRYGYPAVGAPLLLEFSPTSGWGLTEEVGPSPSSPGGFEICNQHYLAAEKDVFVRALETGSFTVEDLAGAVLYTGSISSIGQWVTIPASVFQPNGVYRARFNGVLSDAIIRPIIHHAVPSFAATQPLVVVGKGAISFAGPFMGNSDFRISGWAGLPSSATATSEAFLIALGLGIDDPVTPTVQMGTLSLMSNLVWIAGPWVYNVTPQSPVVDVLFTNPINSASGHAPGLRVVYQWVAIDSNNEMSASDVFGSVVF